MEMMSICVPAASWESPFQRHSFTESDKPIHPTQIHTLDTDSLMIPKLKQLVHELKWEYLHKMSNVTEQKRAK